MLSWMLAPVPLLFLAGAAVLASPSPVARTAPETGEDVAGGPKRPRDGPERPRSGTGRLHRVISRFLPAAGAARRVDNLTVAADIGLFAACVRAGLSTGAAASAVAAAAGPETEDLWSEVAALLTVGVEPDRAWRRMAGIAGLAELAGITRMSQRSGAAIASGCERIADTLRSEAADSANAAAERAGVFIALPLAVCFLPGFIVLGLAPVVISLGLELLG